jgi:S-DNA-T family DNA segregation ATPase FtsK/SpoIIIE
MHSHRANFPNQASHGDEGDRGKETLAGGQGAGLADSPWQEYFFLAPNVRFTRTPDRDIRKQRPEDDAGQADGQGGAAPDKVAAAVPAVAKPAVHPSAPSGFARNRPAGSPSPSKTTEAASRKPVPTVVPSAPQPPGEAAAAAGLPKPNGHQDLGAGVSSAVPAGAGRTGWSFLSDHAFFEFVDPYLSVAPARVAPAVTDVARPAPVTLPAKGKETRAAAAPEITALFRVIDCAQGRAAATAASHVAAVPPAQDASQDLRAPAAASGTSRAAPAPAGNAAACGQPARKPDIAMPLAPRPSLPAVGASTRSGAPDAYEFPSEDLLQRPPEGQGFYMSQERLEQNADLLESVLEDFGVRGEIIHVRPGPVVTLYEFEPAPGVKSSRVIGLADDIARSMSAVSARVAVVPGRNVIGIELPNETRETVYFRELIEADGFRRTGCKLALCLGKTIGGEPVIAELAKMPHLLVAGTTGSGKSVAINTMILSLLYRLKPDECRLIMVDPKMLELSAYDGIPHLLTPVVTDPKKAVTALKWAVREMEDRYRKMARLGVRNIDGYNQRAASARDKGETVTMTVQTGFEKGTGEPQFEEQAIDLAPMPYIVVIVDEMADLMMVAGKEIEGAIQRLAQMARAAGIHLIMATQRPSVDVITGTIKANFPTRISFQVTSKIDSRTILGEQGAEQLLGQGDMLHMAGGGRVVRVHGPFVSDAEVEQVVAHLRTQGRPDYLETVTADEEEEEAESDDIAVFDKGAVAADDADALYEQAVKVVLRDKKCSTSYIQRRLGVGYNKAASLVERMEKEGLVGSPNHVGKREIISGRPAAGLDRDAGE